MLPLFGGYADQFWTNSMQPGADPKNYIFANEPNGWQLPRGYPWLDVEIGGGMAAACTLLALDPRTSPLQPSPGAPCSWLLTQTDD